MSRRGRVLLTCLFVLGFGISLLAYMPASVLWSWMQGSAFQVETGLLQGTIWEGGSPAVTVNGYPVGRLTYQTEPLSVVALEPRVVWQAVGDAQQSQGVIRASIDSSVVLQDTSATVSLAAVSLPLDIDGRLIVNVNDARFMSGKCISAAGEMRVIGSAWLGHPNSIEIDGPLSCQDGIVQVPFAGTVGSYEVTGSLKYHPDNSLIYEVFLADVDPSSGALLSALGFQKNGATYDFSGRAAIQQR